MGPTAFSWESQGRAGSVLDALKCVDADEQTGVRIVCRSLEEPLRWIAQNAGYEGAIVVAKILEKSQDNWGYDARREEYCDLVKAGAALRFGWVG